MTDSEICQHTFLCHGPLSDTRRNIQPLRYFSPNLSCSEVLHIPLSPVVEHFNPVNCELASVHMDSQFFLSLLLSCCSLLPFFSRVLRHSDPLRVPSSQFLFLHHFCLVFFRLMAELPPPLPFPSSMLSLSMRDPRSRLVCETERIGIFAMSHYQGDPWHLGVPLLCMQGMSANRSPVLMKRITHSHADSTA